jgi:hypothetical protein
MQGTVSSSRPPFSWPSLLADGVLLGLMSGPLAAPFLAASGLPGLPLIADIIYAMGQRVCPQPELGLALAEPYQMAVCMRCYGTVLGLVLMRWLYYRDQGRSAYWLEQYGLKGFVITFVLCLLYPLELALQGFPSWGMHHWLMALFGLGAGLGLGAYLMPLLHSSPKTR